MKIMILLLIAIPCFSSYAQPSEQPDLPRREESMRRDFVTESRLTEFRPQMTSPFGFLSMDIQKPGDMSVSVSGGNLDGMRTLGSTRSPQIGLSFSISNGGLSVGVGVGYPLIVGASAELVLIPVSNFGDVQLSGNLLTAGGGVNINTRGALGAANSQMIEQLGPTSAFLYRGISQMLFMSWPAQSDWVPNGF